MSETMYATALKTALFEIRNVCTDVNHAYVLMDNGTVVASDDQPLDPSLEKAVGSIQDLAEKSATIGGLGEFVIDAEKGKVYVSQVNDMYSILVLSKRVDLPFLRTITNIVLPTVLKVLQSINPETSISTPLKSAPIVPFSVLKPAPSEPQVKEEEIEESFEKPELEKEDEIEKPEPVEDLNIEAETEKADEVEETEAPEVAELPSQQLIVDKFGGLMVRSDTIQVDFELLDRWASMLNLEEIREVDVETFRGKTTRCKAKVISDQKLQGRGIIRIPEKACDALELKRGELVRVKPVISEEK